MALTLMRLWMAIDQLATTKCPLLLDFSPEIPENILEPLLLHSSLHINEARIIQQYLRSRHKQAFPSNQSIFSNDATPNCFAVQYFSQSSRLKSIKSTIEHAAQRERDEKARELDIMNKEHTTLDKQAKRLYHQYFFNDWGKKLHDWKCERCSIEWYRDGMEIDLHEWPLPSRRLDAELVVFELGRPDVFTIWRDTTYGIIQDLASMHKSPGDNCEAYIDLESYNALNEWIPTPAGFTPRIILASAAKPFGKAHYSSTKLKATVERVCVNNGLKFQLYDKDNRTWAAGPFNDASLARFGTFRLPPDSPYRHLRYALEGTTHSTNRVISDQFDCPRDLNLHEHIAFGTLRSGPRLQWMNILRGLEEDILTFSSEEVKTLHTQAAWQIGQLDDGGIREWHEDLEDPNFGSLLVHQSRELLKRIEANWLEATSLSTVGKYFSNPRYGR